MNSPGSSGREWGGEMFILTNRVYAATLTQNCEANSDLLIAISTLK
jgi:hypothetical protein